MSPFGLVGHAVRATAVQRATIAQQQARRRRVAVTPPSRPTIRRFTVWRGSDIPTFYRSIEQMCANTLALVPPGVWDEVELLIKAGEGGSWQASFDSHPLAITGPAMLAEQIAEARTFGVRFTPYVVARGRPDWLPYEQGMIAACCAVAGRCNINVEPGAPYWNGPKSPAFIRAYLSGSGPRDMLEVTLIPRQTQVDELGGAECIQAWTDPSLVGSASWECYDGVAGIPGPTSLIPSEAIARLDGWGVPADPHYRLLVVQRNRIYAWAQTPLAAAGLQVWFLDGDI